MLAFLDESDKNKAFEIIIENLLISKMEWLIFSSSGLKILIQNENYANIKMFYNNFLYKEGSKNIFILQFSNLITIFLKELDEILTINFKEKDKFYRNFINELFLLKQKFSMFISNSFDNDPKIDQILKSSLEKYVNSKSDLSEQLLNILHEEIKLSIKMKSNKNLKEFGEKFLVVFKLINDKDLLELEYRKAFCKRILRNSVYINDTEMIFIEIMKKDSGSHFVMKMETMKNDLELSEKLNTEFRIKSFDMNKTQKNSLNNSRVLNLNNSLVLNSKNLIFNNVPRVNKREIEFYVKVLTDSAWPVDKMINNIKNPQTNSCNLPFVLDNYIQDFSNFYYNKFKSRTLTWIHELSWAKINAKFGSRNYSLIVSNYQMSILMIFNSNTHLTFSELLAKLGCSDSDGVKRHLYALFHINILKISKKNYSDDINDDLIYLNKDFYSNHEKIVINVKNKNLNINFIKKDNEISHLVLDDRKHQIDSIIMKTLKQNKRMNFENLKNVIIKTISSYFIPEISLIKNRLDNLIEREYLNRDINNPEFFIYTTY